MFIKKRKYFWIQDLKIFTFFFVQVISDSQFFEVVIPQRMPHGLLERLKANTLKACVQIHSALTTRGSWILLVAIIIVVA